MGERNGHETGEEIYRWLQVSLGCSVFSWMFCLRISHILKQTRQYSTLVIFNVWGHGFYFKLVSVLVEKKCKMKYVFNLVDGVCVCVWMRGSMWVGVWECVSECVQCVWVCVRPKVSAVKGMSENVEAPPTPPSIPKAGNGWVRTITSTGAWKQRVGGSYFAASLSHDTGAPHRFQM